MTDLINITVINEGISYPIQNELGDLYAIDVLKKMKTMMNKRLGYVIEQNTYIKRHMLLAFRKNTPYDQCEPLLKFAFEKYCEYFDMRPMDTANKLIKDIDNIEVDNKELIKHIIEKIFIKDNDYNYMLKNDYINVVKYADTMCDLYLIIFNINFSLLCGKVMKNKVDITEYKEQLRKFKEAFPELKNNMIYNYDHNGFDEYIDSSYDNYTKESLFPYVSMAQNIIHDISPCPIQINLNHNIYLDDINVSKKNPNVEIPISHESILL